MDDQDSIREWLKGVPEQTVGGRGGVAETVSGDVIKAAEDR
jgi:hypothetical protein